MVDGKKVRLAWRSEMVYILKSDVEKSPILIFM
jgi:hypothetical protein